MTHKGDRIYNCGGYALELYDWYDPSPLDIEDEYLDDFIAGNFTVDDETVYDAIYRALFYGDLTESHLMEYMIKVILRDCENRIRKINNLSEVQDDEYGVLFRGGYGDFHFIKYEDGIFSHKMGGLAIETLSATTEEEIDWLGYESETYYFAMKKEG